MKSSDFKAMLAKLEAKQNFQIDPTELSLRQLNALWKRLPPHCKRQIQEHIIQGYKELAERARALRGKAELDFYDALILTLIEQLFIAIYGCPEGNNRKSGRTGHR